MTLMGVISSLGGATVRRMRVLGIVVVAALVACCVTVGASSSGAGETGVERDSITVSAVYGRSGPYGKLADDLYDTGFGTWVDEVNGNGGINGRKVVVERVDNAGTAEGGITACKEVQNNGSFLSMSLEASVASLSFADCMNQAKRITVGAFPQLDRSWSTVYASQPVGTQLGRGLANFLRSAPAGETPGKIGVITLNEAYAQSQRDGFMSAAKNAKLNVVATETVEPQQTSYTSVLQKMRDAKVTDLVLLVALDVLGLAKDAGALGYAPKISGVLWPSFDLVTQAAQQSLEGAVGLRTVATTDTAAYGEFVSTAEKYGHSKADSNSFVFYGDGLVMEKILKSAGKSPTQANLRKGIESIRNYDNEVLAPITWGPRKHEGVLAQFPTQCCSDSWMWKQMGPASATFSTRASSQPTP